MFENLKSFMEVYFNEWVKALKGNEKMYVSNDGKWTKFHMEKILYPLAEALRPEEGHEGYKTKACSDCSHLGKDCKTRKKKYTTPCGYGETWSQEYYRVDLGLFYYPCYENGLWVPDYLIEHENGHFRLAKENGDFKIKKKGWFGEFVKLLPVNCSSYGARVIISYSSFDGKSEDVENYENFLRSVLMDETIQPTLCEKPILVLLGPSKVAIKRKKDPAESFRFIMFEKNGSKWEYDRGLFDRADVVEIFRKLKEELT